MTIDIRGTNTMNSGAHLMLLATVQRLGDRFALSAPPTGSEFDVRARLGLRQTLHDYRWPGAFSTLGNRVPSSVRRRYGLVADSEITGAVDASGFAYSDSFGVERVRREALFARRWSRRAVPRVMLPQAFGPFQKEESSSWYREIFTGANLIFARDEVSAEFVRRLGFRSRLKVSPDFTIAVKPPKVAAPVAGAFGAIVPNAKMISEGVMTQDGYVSQLRELCMSMRAEGLTPLLVVHETGDIRVAELLNEPDVPMFTSRDPLALKSVIGQAKVVAGSRFHGVVAGLSQGVPTLTVGWSHKYDELHRTFGVPEWLMDTERDIAPQIARIIGDTAGHMRIAHRQEEIAAQTDLMWDETESVLNSPGSPPAG